MRSCVVCGKSIDVTKVGRPRATCSNACRQHLYRNVAQSNAYRNAAKGDLLRDPGGSWAALQKQICNVAPGRTLRNAPVALDLFCGGGGAAVGLNLAGFNVVGVDINPQPHYPFNFIQADALKFPIEDTVGFVWASPPCQQYSICRNFTKRDYPDLVATVREKLIASGKPYIIENVPGAPLRDFVTLSGLMFGLKVIRRRIFESNCELVAPIPPAARGCVKFGDFVTVAGASGGDKGTAQQWRDSMGISWLPADRLAQAIPPAFSWFLGVQVLDSCILHPPCK